MKLTLFSLLRAYENFPGGGMTWLGGGNALPLSGYGPEYCDFTCNVVIFEYYTHISLSPSKDQYIIPHSLGSKGHLLNLLPYSTYSYWLYVM